MADKIVVMNQGNVQQIAPPLELYRNPANRFVAGFIGTPSMNFVEGSVERGPRGAIFRESTPDGVEIPLENLPAGMERATVIGIRPEHLLLTEAGDPFSFQATVQVVETLGNQTFIHVPIGRGFMIASANPDRHPTYGDTVHLRLMPERTFFFDADGARLTAG